MLAERCGGSKHAPQERLTPSAGHQLHLYCQLIKKRLRVVPIAFRIRIIGHLRVRIPCQSLSEMLSGEQLEGLMKEIEEDREREVEKKKSSKKSGE